jgi:hypothetical protein
MADTSVSHQSEERPRGHALAWATGGTFFLLFVLAVGHLAIPLWRTRTCLREYLAHSSEAAAAKFVAQMGGAQAAVKNIVFYRRLPRWLAPHKDSPDVVCLMGYCGKAGVPALLDIVRTEQNDLSRLTALKTLANLSPINEDCAGVLAEVTKADTEVMRFYAIVALSRLPVEAARSTSPVLREALWTPPGDRTIEENAVLIGGFLWDVAPKAFVHELQNPDPVKRCVMLKTLSEIERLGQHNGLLLRTVADMSLNDRDPSVRKAARDALENIKAVVGGQKDSSESRHELRRGP